ncbi:MAG: hypothetical protein ABIS50_16945 [Luteolibacter sp.]|uniref:hypothetical protein n=1 Tax=Luteolibacter sp. TaxID=1962973 RepID=UPI00326349DB
MGYNIFLKGDSFDHDGWVEDLGQLDLNISSMGRQFAGMLAEDGIEEMWLHPCGGIRGITVRKREDGAELSLPAGVAEADFLLAGTLIRAAANRGAVVEDEEGDILTGSDEQMRELGAKYRRFFWSAICHGLADGESFLPIGGMLNLRIDPSERGDARWDELEQKQLAKMERYEEAFVASLMQGNFGGVQKVVSNYHHLPTLLSTEADMVILNGEHGDITEGVPVPMERFCEILEGRVEDLGAWKFVAAIDFSNEPELVAKLKSAPRSLPLPTGVAAPSSGESKAGELTGNDWMFLAKMAVFCPFLVASADGKVDRKESVAIANLLKEHQSCPYPVVAKILGIAHHSLEMIASELQSEAMPALMYLALLKSVLEKFPEEEAAQIRSGFLTIATAVAKSSSGLFGFGPKISKKEQAVLDLLQSVLA